MPMKITCRQQALAMVCTYARVAVNRKVKHLAIVVSINITPNVWLWKHAKKNTVVNMKMEGIVMIMVIWDIIT